MKKAGDKKEELEKKSKEDESTKKGKAKSSDPSESPEFSKHSNNSAPTSIVASSTTHNSKVPTSNDQVDVSTKNSNYSGNISITAAAVTPVLQGSNLDCEYISGIPSLKSRAPFIDRGTYCSTAREKGGEWGGGGGEWGGGEWGEGGGGEWGGGGGEWGGGGGEWGGGGGEWGGGGGEWGEGGGEWGGGGGEWGGGRGGRGEWGGGERERGLFSSANSRPFPNPLTNLVLSADVTKSRTSSENDKQLSSTPAQPHSVSSDEKWAWPLLGVAERKRGCVLIEEIGDGGGGGGEIGGEAALSLPSPKPQHQQSKLKSPVMQKTEKTEEKSDKKDRNEQNSSSNQKWAVKICPTEDTNNLKTSKLVAKELENAETLEPTNTNTHIEPTTTPHTNTHIEPTTTPHTNTHIEPTTTPHTNTASNKCKQPPLTKKYVFEKLSDVPATRNYAEVEAAERAMGRVRGRDMQDLSEDDRVWKLAAEAGETVGVDGKEREWKGGMDKEGEKLRERVRKKRLSDKTSLAF